MPTAQHLGRRDHLAGLGVVFAAFGDDANLIYGEGVAGGDQLVVGSEQALSSGEGAEGGLVGESETVHGVIGLGLQGHPC